jgi:hypothetical protein
MPAWIHERAEHILAKNPKMNKSQAFAIATQQSHAKGKTPKGYGTTAGKVIAKAKYDRPKKSYTGTANPQGLKTPKLHDKPKTRWTGKSLVKTSMASFVDEWTKLAFGVSAYSGPLGYGGFKQESHIPPFVSPPLKTAGPPAQKGKEKKAYDPSPLGNVDVPGMRKMRTPARGLQESKQVGTVGHTKPDATKALSMKFAAFSGALQSLL